MTFKFHLMNILLSFKVMEIFFAICIFIDSCVLMRFSPYFKIKTYKAAFNRALTVLLFKFHSLDNSTLLFTRCDAVRIIQSPEIFLYLLLIHEFNWKSIEQEDLRLFLARCIFMTEENPYNQFIGRSVYKKLLILLVKPKIINKKNYRNII